MFCKHLLVYINSKVPFHENLPPPPLPSHRSGVPEYCYIMTVSDLLEQPCNKSDNINKVATNCQQLVPYLSSTWDKQCEHNLLTACWQTCYKMWDFYVSNMKTENESVVYILVVSWILHARRKNNKHNLEYEIFMYKWSITITFIYWTVHEWLNEQLNNIKVQ
jgi:hypothetical protein